MCIRQKKNCPLLQPRQRIANKSLLTETHCLLKMWEWLLYFDSHALPETSSQGHDPVTAPPPLCSPLENQRADGREGRAGRGVATGQQQRARMAARRNIFSLRSFLRYKCSFAAREKSSSAQHFFSQFSIIEQAAIPLLLFKQPSHCLPLPISGSSGLLISFSKFVSDIRIAYQPCAPPTVTRSCAPQHCKPYPGRGRAGQSWMGL
ncbi:hypothetical protein DL89DRAFT_185755 [Linderina pennispora]|uniref:Uncharacterized protein n=1 Tax=Linderina pennispora TaxID=61395 RepID=A0A1Y1VT38_9FUNG|nr:uncharacterized protein DL89DRAFT_185755 [Linderina pennispora]ORX64460.1 hypothetical protein DL89DRAFT_185755 [Linderina pennispora]